MGGIVEEQSGARDQDGGERGSGGGRAGGGEERGGEAGQIHGNGMVAGVPSTNGSSMPQHAAACRSMPQRQILGAVGGGFEACRSMPQRAKIFTWWTFFFITCQTCEPFVARMSQNWMVAQ